VTTTETVVLLGGCWVTGALCFWLGLGFLHGWGIVGPTQYGEGFLVGTVISGLGLRLTLHVIWRKQEEEAQEIYGEIVSLMRQVRKLPVK